jgi:Arc/MetJ-type ribon-helix-helix transcriptional regulator
MRTRATMTVSLPPEMVEKVEKFRRLEHRTASELVREALRRYFERRFPEEDASAREVRALRRARREHTRGETVNLEEVLDELGRRPRGRRAQSG